MDNWQNLFNRDFYPTPEEVIDQMVGMEEVAGKIILEPSFGSGNIVKYLNEHYAKEVIGCEINDKLRSAASGVRVIGSDFLKVMPEDVSHIDMIVMNPPFSRQEEHIIHAWEIAPGGCEIITLCNASLVGHGYYDSRRKQEIQQIIDLHGHTEELGDVFKEAERRTECNIAVIRLFKPGAGENEFDGYFTDEADEPEAQGNGLIQYNFVRECVNRYVAAVSRVDAALAAGNEINELTSVFGNFSIQFGAFRTGYHDDREPVTKEQFRKSLQSKAWYWLFNKFDMAAFVTTSVMEKINRFVERQSTVPFTMRNIYKMVEMIYGTRGEIMQNVVLDAFDIICKYSEDNVTYLGEKWKTNSAHMVNKKFIVPYMCNYDPKWPKEYVYIGYNSYGYGRKMDDVVKALCYVTGRPYQWVERDADGEEHKCCMRTLSEFTEQVKMNWGQWYDWTFFRIKGYKKGTMHFEFQNDDDWAVFNQAVAKVRGWELPANVKVKKGGKK